MPKKHKGDGGGASITLDAGKHKLPVSLTVNTIHATGNEMFFNNVHAVTLENEKVTFLLSPILWDWHVDIKRGVFAIDGMEVECSDLSSCLIHRMEIIQEGYNSRIHSRPSKRPSLMVVYTCEEVSGTNESGSESDTPQDQAIRSPFTNREMGWIDASLQDLWVAQEAAVVSGYHNSYGKDFVRCLLKYVLLSQNKTCNIMAFVSTGPGSLQPGHMTVRWQLERMEKRSTVSGEKDHILHTFQRIPDVVAYDFETDLFPVVVEIKPEKDASGDAQHTEQMIGLFKKHQKIMAGILLSGDKVKLKLLICTDNQVKLVHLKHVNTKQLVEFLLVFLNAVNV